MDHLLTKFAANHFTDSALETQPIGFKHKLSKKMILSVKRQGLGMLEVICY